MIVKTGANYQEEGGYIEASRDGDIITIDGDEYNNKYGIYSVANVHVINESSKSVYMDIGSGSNEAPVYYNRNIGAGITADYKAIYPGRFMVSIPDGVSLNSQRSSGCEPAGEGYLRITDVEATVVFN